MRTKSRKGRDRIRHGEAGEGSISTALAVLTTAIVVPLVVLIATVWLMGWHFAVVETNSMAPGMPAGSLIVASPISADEVTSGMVIEFIDRRRGNRHVTHRVIEVHRGENGDLWFVTQGDNNDAADSQPVRPRDVRSEVRWSVARLGVVASILRPPTSYVIAAVPFVLWLAGRLLRAGVDAVRPRRPVPVGPAGPPVAEDVLTCIDCPAPVAPEDRYCRRCGARQVVVPEGRRLVRC